MTPRSRRHYDAIGLLVAWATVILVVIYLGGQVVRWIGWETVLTVGVWILVVIVVVVVVNLAVDLLE